METLAYLHLALTDEAPTDTASVATLEYLQLFTWLKRQKLATHAWIYLLSLVASLSILGMGGEAGAQQARQGEVGPEVTAIQDRLRELGYFNQSSTGTFGSVTRNAVIQFQQAQGLVADGSVGPATEAALFNDQFGAYSSQRYDPLPPPPEYGQSSFDGRQQTFDAPLRTSSLQRGARGSDVRVLQERLREAGFYYGSIDGIFGAETEAAVREFQRNRELRVDGRVGPETFAALEGVDGPTVDPDRPVVTLRRGSSGPAVVQLQERLTKLGFYSGPITGFYGSVTEEAVRRFQRDRGLQVDGRVGPQTLAALGGGQNRYVVAVPVRNDRTLSEVRRYVRSAVPDEVGRGEFVNAGAFINREDAESRSYLLRKGGLDARVVYLR